MVRLVSSVAHQLGTPLQVISGRAALLQATLGESAQPQLAAIREQCAVLTRHVRTVVDALQVDSPAIAPTDLALVFREVGFRVRSLLGEGLDLSVNIGEGAPPSLRLRAEHLRRAVLDTVVASLPLEGSCERVSVNVRFAPAESGSGPLADSDRLVLDIKPEGYLLEAEVITCREPWFAENLSPEQFAAALRFVGVFELVRRNDGELTAADGGVRLIWPTLAG
jgi:hypothetical protein